MDGKAQQVRDRRVGGVRIDEEGGPVGGQRGRNADGEGRAPGAPDVPQTASTLPGAEGGGGGGGADEAVAGVERRVRVAAMRELTTWSGLPGAATEATPRAMRRERS